ncbi:SRPBCC family protein [Paenibacillus sp. KQZ6P-2]|uniref:SRPBCC family protein n=1 Tax=Paenibacillus mangrovi TaxID=2931978 RepID=A0A9X1WS40_9BACL|nr:SRPBCC family protein [Paenibacillus mangrovi]MCJ8012598.1 SRPBCC family protein [Paenibacillus mangrovi]
MPTIYKEILIDASPEQVWNAVSDVGAVHHRLVPGYTENTIMNGHERTLIMPNGGRVREIIVSIDEKERRMAYAVKESRMSLLHHHASFKVLPHGDNITKLVWTTDFLPEQLASEIQARVDRGSQVMKETIEAEVREGSRSKE